MVQAGDEQIRMAVIVVVRDRNAHVVAGAGQAGGVGHVGKDAIAVVAEQAVAVLRRVFLQRGDVGAVGEEDVRTSVAVVVEDGDSAGHGFGSVPGGGFVVLEAKWESLEFEGMGLGECQRGRAGVRRSLPTTDHKLRAKANLERTHRFQNNKGVAEATPWRFYLDRCVIDSSERSLPIAWFRFEPRPWQIRYTDRQPSRSR